MKTESRILADTRIQKLEPFLNGYRGFLQLRCGKQRAFTFCATRDIPEDGSTYEHVSVGLVSSNTKTPTWEEMCEVKGIFWNETEEVHELHPANGWKW